jgi:hypothetical protein
MKKFIYIAIIAIVASVAFTSCTEENVKPEAGETSNTAGSGSGDKWN